MAYSNIKNTTTSLPTSKQQNFNAENNNIQFENERYPNLSTVLTEEFRPKIDKCTMYFKVKLTG